MSVFSYFHCDAFPSREATSPSQYFHSNPLCDDEPEQQQPTVATRSGLQVASMFIIFHSLVQAFSSFLDLPGTLRPPSFRGEHGERGRSVISHPCKGAESQLTVRLHDFPTLFHRHPFFHSPAGTQKEEEETSNEKKLGPPRLSRLFAK